MKANMSDGRFPVFREPDVFDQIAAWMERVRQSKKTRVLFVSHNMGGGCERHIQELSEYLRGDLETLAVRASGKKEAILHFGTRRKGNGLHFDMPGEYGELVRICKYLAISRIHYHHLMSVHPMVQDLPRDLDIPYDVTLHDYYLLKGNPTLTDKKGCFVEDTKLWVQHGATAAVSNKRVSLDEWRERNGRFLLGAERVIAPSSYTARLYHSCFPDLSAVVAFHPDWERHHPYPGVQRVPLASDECLRIAVLGALNREKGADLLESVARMSRSMRLRQRFHLIGYAYRSLDKTVNVHGPYEDGMLKQQIRDLNPHVIWFPALWPETYSYTLSTALESGIPVVAPDIGAFAERLTHRPLTWIKSWKTSGEEWAAFFNMLRKTIFKGAEAVEITWDDQPETSWNYKQNYKIQSAYSMPASDEFVPDKKWIKKFIFRDLSNSKEKVLLWLLRIRRHPRMAKLLQKVPYPIERRIKRWFSRKPIHEIMKGR